MDNKILEELGFTKNEISIFLTLVKSGPLSATDVAKETGLNRPYVYYALERLLEKGYISEIRIRGKKNFRAVDSNHIISLEEHKIDLLKSYISELEKIKNQKKEEVSVEILKGKFAVKNIFKMCLSEIKSNEEILYIGIDEEKMESIEPLYLEKILNHFKQKKITERLITKKGGKKLSYAKTTEYRFLEESLLGNTAKIIYQDTTIELIYGNPIYVIVIKNRNVTNTAKKQFEVFWKIAEKLK